MNEKTVSKQKHRLAIGALLTAFGAATIAFMLFGGSAIEEWQKGIAKTPPSAFDPLILWNFLGPTLFILSLLALTLGIALLYLELFPQKRALIALQKTEILGKQTRKEG